MKTISFSFSLSRRTSVFSILALVCSLMWRPQPVEAQATGGPPGTCISNCPDGATCGTYTIWDIKAQFDPPPGPAFNPQSITDDVAGITNQVGAPAMVTAMEKTCDSANGLLYWNPDTNDFKKFCVASGFQFPVDLNRSRNSSTASSYAWSNPNQPNFGSGDVWTTVNSNPDYAPYMNFQGSNDFTRWNVGADSAMGIRVNSATGKVYFANYGDRSEPAEIIELDPATNKVRKWRTGNRPYQLWIDGNYVWGIAVGTAVTSSGTVTNLSNPDQIFRLDPTASSGTKNLTRWNLRVNGSFQPFAPVGGTTNPNYITVDLEGQVWFTETQTNKIGRLDPATNRITEYERKDAGGQTIIVGPQNISSSGIGSSLQAFFTEDPGDTVNVLTNSV